MAFSTKKGSFTKSTGGAPASQAVTGIGFQPKSVILFATTQTATGIAGGYQFGFGSTDGTTDYAIAGSSQDAVATSNTDRRHSNTVLTLLSTSGVLTAECTLTSLDADGFTLSWTTNDANAYVIHYMALGGSDLTNVDTGTFNSSGSTGNQSITGTGFQPDIIMIYRIISSTTNPQTTTNLFTAFGAGISSTSRWAIGNQSLTGQGTSGTDRNQVNDQIISTLGSTGLIGIEADLVSLDADGFTINWTVSAASRTWGYIAFKGGQYSIGTATQKTSTGTKATTGIGFVPTGLMMMSTNTTTNASPSTNNRFSLGAASAAGTEGNIWVGDTDNLATMSTDKSNSTTKALTLIDTDAPAGVDAEADLSSFDSDGFTLDWTTADATAREFTYIAFGSDVVAPTLTGISSLTGVSSLTL